MPFAPRIVVALSICFAVSQTQAADTKSESKELTEIHAAIKKVTAKNYDESADYLFGSTSHYEQDTVPYVLEAMIKVPAGVDPGLEVVRGPKAGGYWLDVELRDGFHPYPRAEGRSDRGEFLEYVYFPKLKGEKQHLYIVLRIPKDDKTASALHDQLLETLEPFCALPAE
ncbi:hypothetical protein [Aeoliella sp.]|uniref:hypothetical protein n=1 Tax=Aeoliella sp. TaxID=2795800 RepID=UPI003CCC19CF